MATRALLPLSLLFALFLIGCRHTTQEVPITSVPPGAEVYIDDQFRGMTPLTLELETADSRRLELRKEGYRPFYSMIVAVEREDAPYVRFGLLADAGHYHELQFTPSLAPLVSELVPESRGADPFGSFGERVLTLDQRLEDNLITPEEHARILTQLIVAFE
jgi:hypothetical protein